jgi:CheY-like chemotaxis protein
MPPGGAGIGMNQVVLVVDDDRQMLDLLQLMLGRAGYRVLLADSAVQALDVLEKDAVSAVVLDIMMPVRSGIEVLEHIRWNPKLSKLPVIVLSAAHLSNEEREFVEEFTIGFVDKSHIGELLNRLQALFADRDPPMSSSGGAA